MTELSFEQQVRREAAILKFRRLHRARMRAARMSIVLKYRMGWGPRR